MCCSVLCREKGNKQGGLYGTRDLKVSKAQNLKTQVVSCCSMESLLLHIHNAAIHTYMTQTCKLPLSFKWTLFCHLYYSASVFGTFSRLNSFYSPVRLKLKIISETRLIEVTRRRDRPLTSQWNDFCFTFSDSNRSFCYLTLSGRLGSVSSRKHWGEATFFFKREGKKRAGFGVPARLVECC